MQVQLYLPLHCSCVCSRLARVKQNIAKQNSFSDDLLFCLLTTYSYSWIIKISMPMLKVSDKKKMMQGKQNHFPVCVPSSVPTDICASFERYSICVETHVFVYFFPSYFIWTSGSTLDTPSQALLFHFTSYLGYLSKIFDFFSLYGHTVIWRAHLLLTISCYDWGKKCFKGCFWHGLL